jgi:predicted amidohydrolase
MARLAEEVGAWIGGSMVSRNAAGRLVNRFWLFGPKRDTIIYDKAHLFAPMQEDRYLVAGDCRVRTQVGDFQAALSICFDLRFPEQYRLDAVSGADLFLVVAEWPAARSEAMRLFARARAAESQAFLALCNRAGTGHDGTVFGARSIVTAPTRAVLAEGGDTEQVVHVMLDREHVRLARSTLEVLGARRSGVDHD